ncbi:hypothetical protein BT69DRAFT_1228728 [Atractiella rhizophila]|nr:hypothetical protein BT69DRAFT_1228728 [Atractiella rhizophila]
MAASWSRIVRFCPASNPSSVLVGEPVDAEVDVGLATFNKEEVKVAVYSGSSVLDAGTRTERIETIGRILSPLTEREVGTIRCIGLNYVKHAEETRLEIPSVPILFMHPSTALCDPYPANIIIPKWTIPSQSADYEAELAVVIGKTCKDVSEADALSYVLGYTAGNDVSSRASQFDQSQWCFSKGFDRACPLGPTLVSPSRIPDPSKLFLQGIKNGKVMQESGLDDLIFSIPQIIAFLSKGTTLLPGTVILTGTPKGIGFFYDPPEILRDGDDFRVAVNGGIGTLINSIEYEK